MKGTGSREKTNAFRLQWATAEYGHVATFLTTNRETWRIDMTEVGTCEPVDMVRKAAGDKVKECTSKGKRAAKEGRDFIPIKDKTVTFKTGEVTYRFEVNMPDTTEDEGEVEEIDTVSFALQISDPMPTGTSLSKKRTCFINIEQVDEEAEAREKAEK